MGLRVLVAKIALLGALTSAGIAGLVIFVPEANDLAFTTVDKHQRLDAGTSRRLVFVGGSNLLYGLDSPLVERRVGLYTVNMSMSAEVGMAFMFEDVDEKLRAGDAVVAVPEYVLFYREPGLGVDGRGSSLLPVLKARRASLESLTRWRQFGEIIAAFPEVAHHKALRLLDGAVRRTLGIAPRQPDLESTYEHRKGLNSWGDLVSHRDVRLPGPVTYESLGFRRTLDRGVIDYLVTMRDRLSARGITLVVLPPPVSSTYYAKERDNIRMVASALRAALPNEASSFEPEAYVFPDACVFDSFFHLTFECRTTRTERLIQHLNGAVTPSRMASGNHIP